MRIVVRLEAVRPDHSTKLIFREKTREGKSLDDMTAVKARIAGIFHWLDWRFNDSGVITLGARESQLDRAVVKQIREAVKEILGEI